MKFNSSQGFSLIELLTAMTLFITVSVLVFDLAVSLLRHQEKMVAMQSMFNDSSYAVEYMGRMLRMARRADGDSCIAPGRNYFNPDSNQIKFLDYQNNCRRFLLQEGQIKEEVEGAGGAIPITSANHTIRDLSFTISDSNEVQPRVTISFEVARDDLDLGFKIQTTISQRNLNR